MFDSRVRNSRVRKSRQCPEHHFFKLRVWAGGVHFLKYAQGVSLCIPSTTKCLTQSAAQWLVLHSFMASDQPQGYLSRLSTTPTTTPPPPPTTTTTTLIGVSNGQFLRETCVCGGNLRGLRTPNRVAAAESI
ncbi:unnamed protein product [Polarella glacialis]|uniref:Uncharacterized protein n=1 Tax=Polarella glacialis TaxID=89957 RepID=A0A813JH19_POLGL|nr:unnamed protein product [Polarella glacialis]